MTLTFAIRVIYWSRPTPHLRWKVLASSTAKLCILVLKVLVILTMTFALSVIYWWGSTSLLSLRVLDPSIANLSSFLVLKVLVTLTFAVRIINWWGPTARLILKVLTNHKHCRIRSFFWSLDLWLKGHPLFRSILSISLIVLGLIIANGFLLYVKQGTPPHPLWGGGGLFSPQGHNLNTLVRGFLYISICRKCRPRGGGHFLAPGQ